MSESFCTLEVVLHPETQKAFVEWETTLNNTIAHFQGFNSLEVSFIKPHWNIIQRFNSEEALQQWKSSQEFSHLLSDLKQLGTVREVQFKGQGATEIFVTDVLKGKEKEYLAWNSKIHRIEASFPGFIGTYVHSSYIPNGWRWITVLQFDTDENLENWLQSAERKRLLEESKLLITSFDNHRFVTPYAGWFTKEPSSPAWKQGMIVLLPLFPFVVLISRNIMPYLSGLNPSLATFISNAISVTLLTYPSVPLLSKWFDWWLKPHSEWTAHGTVLLFALYTLEVLFFWFF